MSALSGTVYAGTSGDVIIGSTSIADITQWSFNTISQNSRYASSGTAGYKATVAGVLSGTGSIAFKWNFAAASQVTTIAAGTAVTLILQMTNSPNYKFTVPAVVSGFLVSVNIDSGEVIGGSCNFDSNGAWTSSTSHA